MKGMRKIGITGTIGAGKSFVSSLLRERGYTVLDTDRLVHELYRDCKELRAELAEAFGPECLTEGGVNRAFFVERAFTDKSIRNKLESTVYPYLTQAVRDFFDEPAGNVAGNGAGNELPAGTVAGNELPRFLEAALLSRVPEIVGMLDEIWIVDAPEWTRLERLVARGMAPEDAKRRTLDQAGVCNAARFPGKKLHTIENSKETQSLNRQLDSLLGG